uniref:Glycosyltransferase n=1 Tax=Anthurium amnicola TaxID=1678845 RepID=A0A1D1Y5F8_9ARAE
MAAAAADASAAAAAECSPRAALPHVAIFPFMSKGHTIPLLHLARLLHRRRLATFTFFTTPLNAPHLRAYLADLPHDAVHVVELPFPRDSPGLPPGVENTDQLPSMSLFLSFVGATKRLRPDFEQALGRLSPPATFLLSDAFHVWTLESARELGIPRLMFYGMGWYAMAVSTMVSIGRPHAGIHSEIEPFRVPGFPHIQLTKADLAPPFDDPTANSPLQDFVSEQAMATLESQGVIVNSFYEMEAAFADHWNRNLHPKGWCVGPLCLAQPPQEVARSLRWEHAEWLDARLAAGRPVLYVSFGTQAELPAPQLEELAAALENSGLDFFWVLRNKEGSSSSSSVDAGYDERVAGRGVVAREWVPQMEVLSHAAIRGFLSHCGWNSVLEGVCAGVPILAWPLMAEQHLNAKLVVEELGVGLRVRTADGTREGLVRRECVEEMARALLMGEEGRAAAARVGKLKGGALRAMEGAGSSWSALAEMVEELCGEAGKGRVGELGPSAPNEIGRADDWSRE